MIDTDYLYGQLAFMSDSYHNRVSGADGDPRTPGGAGDLPPLVNGWQEFYAHWKQQMTNPDVMGGFTPDIRVSDHYFRVSGLPDDSDVREVTIPGATCPGQRVLVAGHPDGTPGLNTNNGSAYDDTSGVVMGIAELKALTAWWQANGTWPQRTIKVGLFDAEETGLNGSYYYAANLIPKGPQGQYVLVANMDQNGVEYPAYHLGTKRYFTNNPFGDNGPWRTNINASPLSSNSIYSGAAWQAISANLPAIQAFRAALADSVAEAFTTLGAAHNHQVPLENPLEAGATAPAYSDTDRTAYSPVQDDTLGRTDQVPFVAQGIPGYGVLGAYDSNAQENPYPNGTPLQPPIFQYAGYDTPRDTKEHLNLLASGTDGGTAGSAELKAALELPATWTDYLLTRDAYAGAAPRPTGPVAYFETDPVHPDSTTVSFDGSLSSDAARAGGLAYTWDFGDGTFGSGPTVTHTFASPRFADVRLVVRDAAGHVSGYRQAVDTSGGKAAAPATSGCGQLTPDETVAVLSGAGSPPGTDVPEAPYAVLLPLGGLAALAIVAGRRHRSRMP